ncbi:MAG: 2-oxoacid:ferredoxin oxidoreductase subunit gamma [Gemmatimonadetes bacterium]|nr:2-oxoacid:ferredoxin oxidoreductase subunit gamma [Gemmatimonadota bacterium]NIO32474.1 2-oxoacid:ferredoxin oxidoreductase subunit gamma [Gemmatimonadota bacterium]
MNIRFSGFGGQGIVLSGYIYGVAAVFDGKKALQTQSYGSESRGGGCRSDVIISEDEIFELAPPSLDVLVALSQAAYDTYLPALKENGTLILEDDLVDTGNGSGHRTFRIKATDIAHKKFGRKIMANMVMLGFICAIMEAVSRESLERAIMDNVPKGTETANQQAFEEGYRIGRGEAR